MRGSPALTGQLAAEPHLPVLFEDLLRVHRRELLVHCYRMLGSWTDAEDVFQEVSLRAWRGLDRFEGRASARSWLYRIATNACLSALHGRSRRTLPEVAVPALTDGGELPPPEEDVRWVQPMPSGGGGRGLVPGVGDAGVRGGVAAPSAAPAGHAAAAGGGGLRGRRGRGHA